MNRRLKKLFVLTTGCLVFWLFVLDNMHLARGKDPDYPTRAINFIIPYGAGGTTDAAARALIEATKKDLSQPMIPINKGGAGGSVGAMAVINAKPDGYTIGAYSPSAAISTPLSGEVPYNDLSGFTFIVTFGKFFLPVVIKADSSWKTWREFIEWARKHPGDATIALVGSQKTSQNGLNFRQIEQREKVKFTYITFKGAGEGMNALLGGHIMVNAFSPTPATVSLLQSGKIRVLVYFSDEKLPGFEDAPTIMDLYGIDTPLWLGIWGPKGLPDYIVKILQNAFSKGMKDPDFIKLMNMMYMPVMYWDSSTTTRRCLNDFETTREIIRKLETEEEIKEKK